MGMNSGIVGGLLYSNGTGFFGIGLGGGVRPDMTGGGGGSGPRDEKSGFILTRSDILYLYRQYNCRGRYIYALRRLIRNRNRRYYITPTPRTRAKSPSIHIGSLPPDQGNIAPCVGVIPVISKATS